MHTSINILQDFQLPSSTIKIWVPDQVAVKHLHQLAEGGDFPFWAKVWPAAIGMIQFLEENPTYIEGKQVLEIAAGIGLPSFYASSKAASVVSSDYMQDAILLLQQNIQYHQVQNMTVMYLDWNDLPITLNPETVLMCDVNYHPDNFEGLYKCIETLIKKGCSILLATPQRLVARNL